MLKIKLSKNPPPTKEMPKVPVSALEIPKTFSPDAEIAPALNPDFKQKDPLDALLDDNDFRNRLDALTISPDDLSLVCQGAEEMGRQGNTIQDFASRLGILADELDVLRKKYPRLERSLKVAKGKRNKFLGDLALAHAARNPTGLRDLMNSHLGKDFLTQEEETEIERLKQSVDHRAEEKLQEYNIEPCSYTQVVYLVGDMPPEISKKALELRDYKELHYLSAQEVLNSLSNKEVKNV